MHLCTVVVEVGPVGERNLPRGPGHSEVRLCWGTCTARVQGEAEECAHWVIYSISALVLMTTKGREEGLTPSLNADAEDAMFLHLF